MRVTEKKLTLLFLFVFLCSEIFSQKFLIEAQFIGVEDGLPDRDVFDIVQDREGFIWVATRGAISRYDGERFKTYTSDFLKTLDQNFLNLAVDQFNRIWYCEEVGKKENYGGIIDTRKDSIITFESLSNGLFTSKDVLHIENSKINRNEVLITTLQGGVYKYTASGFEKIFQVQTNSLYAFFCEAAADGSYWILGKNNVSKIRNGAATAQYSFSKTDIDIGVRRIIPHPSEFIIECNSLNKYSQFWKLENGIFVPFSVEKNNLPDLSIAESDRGEIFYINKDINLSIRDYAGKPLFYFENQMGRGIFKDNRGIYWVATTDGLLKITVKENPFTILQKGGNIRGIYKDENWLCIGDYFGNQFKNLKTDEYFHPFIVGRAAMSFSKDKNGHVWVGSSGHKILELKPGQIEWTVHDIPTALNPNVIIKNTETGHLLIGSTNGLFILDLKTKSVTLVDLPGFSRKIHVRAFHQNESGFWVTTSKGVYLLDPKTEEVVKRFSDEDGMPNINLIHLYEDAEGVFWLASKSGGLIRWDIEVGNFQQFTQEDGLFNNTLYAVYEDDFGNLWLPSNYGLMCFDKKSQDTRVFLPKNGIPHEEFNKYAHFKSADGTMYFGGLSGLVKFHPKDFLNSTNSDTPLMLTGLRVLTKGKKTLTDKIGVFQAEKNIELAPEDQVLELDLAMLDYESSEQNQFAYQIEGYQNQWIYTKDSRLSIIKPPYGNFQLNIKGRSAAGTWSEEMLSIPLFVSKPFYLKNWFLLLLGLSFLALVYAYFNRRVRRLRKTQQLLESEVKNRTRQIEKDKEIILAQSEDLKALDKAKTQFFSNVTHEFRTPLTLIIGPTEQLITEKINTSEARKKLSVVAANARHLLTLVNQLLDLSKLEGGNMKKETNRGDIVSYTEALIERFQSVAAKKDLKLKFKSDIKNRDVIFDKNKWDKIVYNLISNAQKFTPTGGSIEVKLSKIKSGELENINLSVSDTGIGIDENNLTKIFDRFYQADNSMTRLQEGTGIGLSLVKELVEFQGGKISVSSKVGEGTEFTVLIPLVESEGVFSPEPIKEDVLSQQIDEIEKTATESFSKIKKSEEKFRVLIIDDNDDLRGYIRSCLDEPIYETLEAADGKAGLELALSEVPDLIISDVMMPQKDGFELLNDIRKEIATSHIPVVLLTAKASLDSRLEGLEGGADVYLTKPFNPQELVLRVQKLIEVRRSLQKRYSNGSLPSLKESPHQKEDEFVTNLRNFIIENIDTTNLSGDVIGKHFFISRVHLHRKLKALTGQSISEYVKAIRLQKSVELLEEKKWRISEIADKVGFSSISHFSRVFKEEFGKSPTKI